MTRTKWIWLICGGVYMLFFGWYTSFGGPLTDAEIADYLARFEQRDPSPGAEELARVRRFLEEDTGDDFVMLNLIEMHDAPMQIDGVNPGDTSADVLDRYMEYMYPAMFARASHPVFFGTAANVAMDLFNAPGMEVWTQGAGVRYRSRRDLMDIASNPEFSGSHAFKAASMAKTIAVPLDPWMQLGDPRILLALLLGLIGFALSWKAALRNKHAP